MLSKIQGGKTFCASFCASLIAGSRREFSVCCLCLFVAGVLSEMHEVRTFASCKAFLFDMFAFFGRLKITLDSEQPMLKTDHPSVWGGIKQFEHFQRGLYFSDNRPLALRGHVTNTSLKRLVGILLMPKIDRAHKNYLTCEIWEKKPFKGDILWHFDFSTK